MSTSTNLSKIVIGTAQFGLRYGVANQTGQVLEEQVEEILLTARRSGINQLDTAIAYGESEVVLGKIATKDWGVITKLPQIPNNCSDISTWIADELAASLGRLGVRRIDGLLLHRPAQLSEPMGEEIYCTLCKLKQVGLVGKIGISIYEPEELSYIFPKMYFDIVQAPFNILDRRIVNSGWAKRIQEAGMELHVRSVFLQGLLLMPAALRPPYFDRWKALWKIWDSWLAEVELTPLQACLQFALSVPEINKLVLGIDSSEQLEQILAAADGTLPKVARQLYSDDLDLLNPAKWNLK